MSQHSRRRPRCGTLPARLALAGALAAVSAASAGLGAFPAVALAETPNLEAPTVEQTSAVPRSSDPTGTDPADTDPAQDQIPLPEKTSGPAPATDPSDTPDPQPAEGADPAAGIAQHPATQPETLPEPIEQPKPRLQGVEGEAVDPATVIATASASGPGGPNWFRGQVTVTVSAPSEAFGVAYRLDGGQWVEATNTLDLTVDVRGEGSHTIAYRAIVGDPGPEPTLQATAELAPGLEYGPTGTLKLGVDTVGPTVTGLPVALRGTSPTFTVGQHVRFEYRCGDALSGVVTCDSTPKAGGFLDTASPGTHTARITARDAAGNMTVHTVRYRVLRKSQAPVEPTRPTAPQPAPNGDSDELAMTGGGGTGPGPVIAAALAAVLGAGTLLGGVGSVRRGR